MIGIHRPGISDPIKLAKVLWPNVSFYREQRDIIYSVRDNYETYVVAANKVGKDYTAAFVVLCEFLTHVTYDSGARIVTTSVRDDHLRVLWGEIGRFISDCIYPITSDKGGPLLVTHREIRWVYTSGPKKGQIDPISYIRGMTCDRPEAIAGHHAPYTLGVIDEASGVKTAVYDQMRTWMKRLLAFGNPNPCVDGNTHFFYSAVKGGDIVATDVANESIVVEKR